MNEGKAIPPESSAAKQSEKNRTPIWILVSVVIGFMLPVCSCTILIATSLGSLSLLGPGSTAKSGIGDAVAIVRVEGTILSGSADDLGTGAISGVVIDDLKNASDDPAVKAIILRVDSPGGTVTGSTQIYEALQKIEKPVVTSMGGVAASGGYQISLPTDYVFARADTLTGSIGVIMTLFNAEELIDEVGVDVITITSGPNKAIGSMWEEMSPEHRDIFEELIDESYDMFIQMVADGRNLPMEDVRLLADGRVYSGRQALANDLVDELGNLNNAIAKAADLGGIVGEPGIIEYEHIPGLDQFLTGVTTQLNQSETDKLLGAITEFTTPALEYRYVGPGSQ